MQKRTPPSLGKAASDQEAHLDRTGPVSLMDLRKLKRPGVIAHRGYRAKYPENTLAAFRAALDAGVDRIELDVLLSKDRKMVVIHDAALERTTNGKGPVGEFRLAELKDLDAGSWFDSQFAGEGIPTLEEVLDLVDGQVPLNIEIKRAAYEPKAPFDAIEKQLVDLVRGKKMTRSVLVSSFEWRVLQNISELDGAPAIALLSRYPDEDNHLEVCRNLRAFSWHPSYVEVKRAHVAEMHEAGIMVFPYNADTREDVQRMLDLEVDGVITSDPLLLQGYGRP
jgi:glycerophosphoryl diester phosphodiesterase